MKRLLGDVITAHYDSGPIYDDSAFYAAVGALEKALPVWQPIETAPKDGEQYVAWDGEKIAIIWWAGYWEVDEPFGKPTHWMPLPAPPEEG